MFVFLVAAIFFIIPFSPASAACQNGSYHCSGGWIEQCVGGYWEAWSSCDCGSCRNSSSRANCCFVECVCDCIPNTTGGTCTSCCDEDHQNCACDCTPNTSGGTCTSCCNTPYNNTDIYPCGCTSNTSGGSSRSCCDSDHDGTTSRSKDCPYGCTADVYGGECKACPKTALLLEKLGGCDHLDFSWEFHSSRFFQA
jgi:hypothetical protein